MGPDDLQGPGLFKAARSFVALFMGRHDVKACGGCQQKILVPGSERDAFIKLLPGVGDVVVEPWCERTTIDKNVAALGTGLVCQIDLGIWPAPSVLLVESSCHLSGNTLQSAEVTFQEAQHVFVDWFPLISNHDTRELVIQRTRRGCWSSLFPRMTPALVLRRYSMICGPARIVSKSWREDKEVPQGIS